MIARVRHVHIRDCKGRQQGPGKPEEQTCGRGDIDLAGYLGLLCAEGYDGPVDLEIIGAKEYSLDQCRAIAIDSLACMRQAVAACAGQ